MNFYSWHIGDYASHTRGLSLLEDLAYRRLLDLYYLTENALETPEKAARAIGMAEHITAVEYVLVTHWQRNDNGFVNKRADEEIAKYRQKAAKAAVAGKASASRRSVSVERPFNVRSTSVEENPTSVEHPLPKIQRLVNQPITKNQEPIYKEAKAWSPSDEQQKINAWFGRRNSTKWSSKELSAWNKLDAEIRREGIESLAAYYSANTEVAKFRRKDLLTLLNNWQGEIDRWRGWQAPSTDKKFDVKRICI